MRLVVGHAACGVNGGPIELLPQTEAARLRLNDLIELNTSNLGVALNSETRQKAVEKFEGAGLSVVADLTAPGAWPLIDCLLASAAEDTQALFLFPTARTSVARLLENGADGERAIELWREGIDPMYDVYVQHRRRVFLANEALALKHPHEFQHFCSETLGVSLGISALQAKDPAPIYMTIAAQLVAETPDIAEIDAQLRIGQTKLGASPSGRELCLSAIDELGELSRDINASKRVEHENRFLRMQLGLVRSKIETEYKPAAQKALAVDRLKTKNAMLKADAEHLRRDVEKYRTSTSWRISAPIRAFSRIVRRFMKFGRSLNKNKDEAIIRASELFDSNWYQRQYPDVSAAGLDPVKHYVKFGGAEGRAPGPNFDSAAYLNANPDVAAANINPLVHYIKFGKKEARPLSRQPTKQETKALASG